MKKNKFYLLAHQDDEFGVFIDIYNSLKKYNIYIFYLTNGSNKKKVNSKLSIRDQESLKVLKQIGIQENNIIFLGKNLNVKCNCLYLNIEKTYTELCSFLKKKKIKPSKLVSLSWEGGHEDHDACNLITRKLAYKFDIIKECNEFSLYNAFNTKIIYFRVFNPIYKKGIFVKTSLLKRLFFIKLLFIYKSQFKIWIGLYPFIICHYLFLGYNFLQPLNKDKIIKKPHKGKLLYEFREFCKFNKFRTKTFSFLNDIG